MNQLDYLNPLKVNFNGFCNFYSSYTVDWGEYGTAGGEVGTLSSQERDVMEANFVEMPKKQITDVFQHFTYFSAQNM